MLLSHHSHKIPQNQKQKKPRSDHLGFILIDHQIPDRLVLLVGSAQELQPITIGQAAAAPLSIHDHLLVPGADTDRGFLTFAGSLPEADVVQEFIHVRITCGESLLKAVAHVRDCFTEDTPAAAEEPAPVIEPAAETHAL